MCADEEDSKIFLIFCGIVVIICIGILSNCQKNRDSSDALVTLEKIKNSKQCSFIVQ